MSDTTCWQIFKWEDADQQDPIDERDPGVLRYVGRIEKPEGAHSYWKPDEDDVGQRFGAGQYVLLDDELILNWERPDYGRDDAIVLDIVGVTTYEARPKTEVTV